MATYYVAKTGNNGNPGTSGSPKLTIAAGVGLLSAGDTLIVRDGTYAESLSIGVSGSAGNYITIQTENYGGVITQELTISERSYLTVDGFRCHTTGGHTVTGNHIKIKRTEFKGGASTGNNSAVTIGTNDNNNTADVLLQDCWAHGSGGRYNLLVYNTNRVILRRCVVRHDGGWDDLGSEDPEAGIQFYNSQNCLAQNCIVLDSVGTYSTWQSAFYSVYNTASPQSNANNTWRGCIALNNREAGNADGASLRFDGNGSQTGHVVTDFVGWDSNWGINGAFTASVGVTVTRATLGNNTRAGTGYGIGEGSGGTKVFKNLIIKNENTADLSGATATYFDTHNNGSTSTGTGRQTYDPFTNGLQYLMRIEDGSNLKTAGESGDQMGAQIVKKWGTDDTLHGETGYDTITTNDLWPWPYEARIFKEMCTDVSVTVGFGSDPEGSLTNYIADYLGNGNPYTEEPPVSVRRHGSSSLR